jgi:16S rRNA (cytidine1402-2'-O)-methyltransferase
MKRGELFLIPVPLGNNDPSEVLSQSVFDAVKDIDIYIVENEKTARRFIKSIYPEKIQNDLKIFILDKNSDDNQVANYLDPIQNGLNIGLMSEAGTPGIADPGALIVELAHKKGIKVRPLVGPSSILLAMMASGLNGQSFAFNGYLPIDKFERKKSIKHFEKISQNQNQSQIFIETPYRNNKLLEELSSSLSPFTKLTIAVDITLKSEQIITLNAEKWKKHKIDLHKRPAIFIFHKK